MEITCTECQKLINLPDDKLPKDKAFSITCPGCKEKVRVDQHLKSSSPQAKSPEPSGLTISADFEDDDELVIYGENDRLALILDEKNKDIWVKVLEEKGYKIQFAKSPEHAIHKMKFTQFHFVALHEGFGEVSLEESPAYQSIIELPMALRRNIFVALVSTQFRTLNNMDAFANSVNVIINENDIDKLSDILKKSIAENEIFYKVFKETLHALGKS